ncbi:MAG: hypothetical protein V4812_01450 [Pseudomonadota bacterium]
MRKWTLLLLLLTSAVCHGQEVTQDSLQGKWVITSTNGVDDGAREDGWTFAGNQWIVWSGKRNMSPDPFTVQQDVVDLGYSKLHVLEKTATTMKVKVGSSSIEYSLELLD